MSRIFTPSERSRRHTNPQPVQTDLGGVRRSQYLVILKNIFGSPVSVLWMLFIASLFLGYEFNTWIAVAISAFTAIYIGLDRFSHFKEFKFFRIGIEIPAFLLLLFIGFSNLSNGFGFVNDYFLQISSWLCLLYLLTYSLNLFPGLNKIFSVFLGVGILYSIASIWQFTSGLELLWKGHAPSFINATNSGLSLLETPHAFVSGLFCIYCLSFFFYKRRKLSALGIFFGFSLVLGICSLLLAQKPIFLSALIIPGISYCIFVSHKTIRDLIITALVYVCLFMGISQFPVAKDFISNPIAQEASNLQKDYWRDQFESFKENIWLGKSDGVDTIYFNREGVSENQNFLLESNYYLFMITQKGLVHFLFMILMMLFVLFMSLRLLADIPLTHHWHKVFIFSMVNMQIFMFVSFLALTPWYSMQITSIMLAIYALCLYTNDAYTKQIVPDDKSL